MSKSERLRSQRLQDASNAADLEHLRKNVHPSLHAAMGIARPAQVEPELATTEEPEEQDEEE